MLIAVVGGTGVLGSQVIPRLVERGHQVRAIVRRQERARHLQRTGVEAALGDIFQPESLRNGMAGCEAALHLATAVPRPGQPLDWTLNDRIRREGTRNLIAACESNGIQKYIQQSIALLYGDCGRRIVDESEDLKPALVTQSAFDMESLVRSSGLDWCILRGGLFYGPRTGREEDWRSAASNGTFVIPEEGEALLSLVRAIDMARAVILAVERMSAQMIFNVVDDVPMSFGTLFSYIAAQLDAPEPKTGGEAFLPSLGCSNARIKEELGWQPMYPSYLSGLA